MKTIQRGMPYAEQKYFGCYRAHVVDNDDPKQIGRVVLQVPEIFGLDWVTDWAQPKTGWLSAKYDPEGDEDPESDGRDKLRRTPGIGGDKGDFFVPDIRDGVWVEFEAGDPCRPLWSGRWFAEPEGQAEPPKLARELTDETQRRDKETLLTEKVPDVNYEEDPEQYKEREVLAFPKGTDRFVSGRLVGMHDAVWPADYPKDKLNTGEYPDSPVIQPHLEEIQEPKLSYRPKYPKNRVLKTKRGTVIELEDTWDEETNETHVRIHIWHPSKTWREVHPDGSVTERVAARRYTCIEADDDLHIKGNHNVCVEGDATLRVKGDLHTFVEGNRYTRIEGNDITHVKGNQETLVEKDQLLRVCTNQKEWIDVDQSSWIGQDDNLQVARNKQTYVHEHIQKDCAGDRKVSITKNDQLHVSGSNFVSVTRNFFSVVSGNHSEAVEGNRHIQVSGNDVTNAQGEHNCFSTGDFKQGSAGGGCFRQAASIIDDKCGNIHHGA